MSWWQRLRSCNSEPARADNAADRDEKLEMASDGDVQVPASPIKLEITDILDLHSFAPRDVAEVVKTYLEAARAKGFTTVRIIHGKGMGTQRAIVRAALDKAGFVASYQEAPAEAGGWGATVVWFSAQE